MTQIAETTSVPLWQRTVERIAEEIRRGRFAPGERFYTLNELSERYGISNITSRRVIDELDGLGLVEKIPARGAFVRQPAPADELLLLTSDDLPLAVIRDLLEPTFAIIQGVFEGATRRGLPVEPVVPETILLDSRRRHLVLALERQLAALPAIEADPRAAGKELIVVSMGVAPHQGYSSVWVDTRAGARMATRHLLERGHRRIGFLTTRVNDYHIFKRFDGYLDGLREAGLELDLRLVHQTLEEGLTEAEALAAWRELDEPPTAVLASGYSAAKGLWQACRDTGLSVPEQLAIIAFDNTRESGLLQPSVSVVDCLGQELGAAAVELSLELAANGDPEAVQRRLEPRLVIRESTGGP